MDSALLSLSTRATRALARLQAAGRVKSVFLPGSRAAQPADIRWRFDGVEGVDPAGRTWRILEQREDGGLDAFRNSWSADQVQDGRYVILDLSDPLTAAGLIVLVREAIRCPVAYVSPLMRRPQDPATWVLHWLTRSGPEHGPELPTELEALTSALESAAERWAA